MLAELVVRTPDLEAAVRVFESVGFRVDMVVPADDPSAIAISSEGLRILLERGDGPPATIRIVAAEPRTLEVPGGTRIELGPAPTAPEVPPLAAAPVITRADADAWHPGRAGMTYRDLVPGRLGGWLIASHIRIPEGGPVPDYVHHHAVRFQLLVCRAGRVRVRYEDQGEIVMEPGDCVLQPPHIRHRVVECSPGFEVIEVACPAVHPTFVDHALDLPTPHHRPDRDFDGQRFLWHRAAGARWRDDAGWQVSDLELRTATGGLVDGRVLRGEAGAVRSLAGSLCLGVVLAGRANLSLAGADHGLGPADAFVVPADAPARLVAGDACEVLDLTFAP
jgi:quercetin dioxygenase-like cupin family protein